jgi:hypothetical protein
VDCGKERVDGWMDGGGDTSIAPLRACVCVFSFFLFSLIILPHIFAAGLFCIGLEWMGILTRAWRVSAGLVGDGCIHCSGEH